MIEARELTRSYGDLTAVESVSFRIGRGEIVGLLGHNGAGKTTIMKMLTGFLEPDSGEILIDGRDSREQATELRARIGYLPENCPLYPEMTVIDSLEHQAALRAIPRSSAPHAVRAAIERTGLEAKATARIETLSRGYRQRVGVAQAILHTPAILVLDEPTNGLDPSQILQMRSLIRELAEEATVLISTHILQEVEAICDRVLIMRGGRMALDARLSDIGRARRLELTLDRAPDDAAPVLTAIDGVDGVEHLGGEQERHCYALACANPEAQAPLVASALHAAGMSLFAMTPERQDLEALFGAINAGSTNTALEASHV